MKTITAAEAKNAFGKFLDMARREPVIVTKNNRPVGVFLSIEDLEDTIWGERARKAHAQGYLGSDASEALINDILRGTD
jgi:prevent-host-death family protein